MRNEEVAMRFAKIGLGIHDGVGSNLYIHGYAIYSYGQHFPIAYKLNYPYVLFNKHKYSQTTSRHQSMVRRWLLANGWKIIEVPTSKISKAISLNIRTYEELILNKIVEE